MGFEGLGDLMRSRCLSQETAASADGRFEFQKRSQLFIRTHNEALIVPTMRVSNPDRSPLGING